MNIAEKIKKQTDAMFRQKALNGTEGVTITGIVSGVGAPAPTVNNPPVDLTAHKASADHDGRYYTEAEVDALLAGLGSGGSGAFDYGLITDATSTSQDWGTIA